MRPKGGRGRSRDGRNDSTTIGRDSSRDRSRVSHDSSRISRRTTLETGRRWEDAASEYLAEHGVRTLLRGYRCRLGELDLICADGDYLVIVEVRARSTTTFASAKSSVDGFKQRKILLATRHLLMRHPEWLDRPLRFDVVAIENIESATPTIEWIRHAFDAG